MRALGPQPRAARGQYVRSVGLSHGVSIAKIYKLGDHHYRAEGFADGASFGSIEARPGRPYAAGNLNGMYTARVIGTVEAGTDRPYGVFRIGGVWAVMDLDGGIASYVGPATSTRAPSPRASPRCCPSKA